MLLLYFIIPFTTYKVYMYFLACMMCVKNKLKVIRVFENVHLAKKEDTSSSAEMLLVRNLASFLFTLSWIQERV